jgi:hypothetical protein
MDGGAMTVTVRIFASRDTTTPTVRTFEAGVVQSSHGGDLQIRGTDGTLLFTVDGRDLRATLAQIEVTP